MTKLTVAFSNFVNAPQNETSNSFIFGTYVMYTLLLDIILNVIDKPKHVVLNLQENTYSNL
jgi:hypothetical protein